ncbi:MAG: hypothetical protein IH595_02640 [Bacteroidales bacterium]|nr:hypothetical protein [Bacteroidales bacterium]
MKKTALIFLMGALVAIFTLPSFTSKMETGTSSAQDVVSDTNDKTINLENVLAAYKAEVTASAMYTAYSEKARAEKRYEIALMFRAISTATAIHAKNHRAVLEKAGLSVPEVKPEFTVRSTKENLQEAIDHETHQTKTLYPEFVINANKAQNNLSKSGMNYAYLTSYKHKDYLQKAIDAMESHDMGSLASVYFVCPNCGNIYEYDVHAFCQFSKTPYTKFIKISD